MQAVVQAVHCAHKGALRRGRLLKDVCRRPANHSSSDSPSSVQLRTAGSTLTEAFGSFKKGKRGELIEYFESNGRYNI